MLPYWHPLCDWLPFDSAFSFATQPLQSLRSLPLPASEAYDWPTKLVTMASNITTTAFLHTCWHFKVIRVPPLSTCMIACNHCCCCCGCYSATFFPQKVKLTQIKRRARRSHNNNQCTKRNRGREQCKVVSVFRFAIKRLSGLIEQQAREDDKRTATRLPTTTQVTVDLVTITTKVFAGF